MTQLKNIEIKYRTEFNANRVVFIALVFELKQERKRHPQPIAEIFVF
jgi:hypothetical protein